MLTWRRRFETARGCKENKIDMKRLLRRYIRRKVWKRDGNNIVNDPGDYDKVVEWIMEGYPFRWRARLWAVLHSKYRCYYKDLYEWLNR